jgi:hypothetical protein
MYDVAFWIVYKIGVLTRRLNVRNRREEELRFF